MATYKPWFKQIHWQIIIGLIVGLLYGILAATVGWARFTSLWIAPFGVIFMNLLKLIAVPLVLSSLIVGVASLADIKKLGRIGGKTLAIYIGTTAIAISIGLVLANVLEPGHAVPAEIRDGLMEAYSGDVGKRLEAAKRVEERSPIQFIVEMVPDNFFASASDNRNMLQIVFVSIILGIGLLQISQERAKPVLDLFRGLNDLTIRLVDLVMLLAPLGVFALMADTITSVSDGNLNKLVSLLGALAFYCLTVIGGLAIHNLLFYPTMLYTFSKMSIRTFFGGITKAQLVAFSTSSSGATLPVTMECAEERLGVSEEVSSFVLPLGATINMDGTALYQGVATVFIAQALGLDLTVGQQLNVLLLAVMASIGTAAVPGAGIIMLIIILESVNVPSGGIALILGVDRILDMLRTVTNVTGDSMVAVTVAASEGQLRKIVPDPDDAITWKSKS